MAELTRPMEQEYLRRIRAFAEFDFVGFRADALPHGGIVISRGGQIRGVWTEKYWQLEWRTMDEASPAIKSETIDDALRVTLKLVLASLKVRRRGAAHAERVAA